MQKILIIGNGIAGASLAWTLHQKGVEVTLADGQFPDAASAVAAGVINPITGRRYVKTWKLDVLQPFAKQFYQDFEQNFEGEKIWNELPIVRILGSVKEQNEWAARSGDAAYAPWMGADAKTYGTQWKSLAHPESYFGLAQGSAQVEMGHFCSLMAHYFEEKGRFWHERLPYAAIARLKKQFDAIVFCEGYRAKFNPYFPNLPWQAAKGEVLWIDFPELEMPVMTSMLKKEVMIVPYGTKGFWAGANYEWFYDDALPSQAGRAFIEEKLKEMLAVPYRVLAHRAAIRPTARQYRPFLGKSRIDEQLFLFSGLGTKGALLAPYWAQHLSDHILNQKELEEEVNWERYQKTV